MGTRLFDVGGITSVRSGVLQGPLVVQVLSVAPMSVEAAAASGMTLHPSAVAAGTRVVLVTLSDGHSSVTAATTVPPSGGDPAQQLTLDSMPGTKVGLVGVPIKYGKLVLGPSNCTVLGEWGGGVCVCVANWALLAKGGAG